MSTSLIFGVTALLSLVPASLLSYRRSAEGRDLLFWVVLGAAVVGPLAFTLAQLDEVWRSGLSIALWVSIATSAAFFAVAAAVTQHAWRLAPLLLPYLCLLGLLAVVWGHVPAQPDAVDEPGTWLAIHIAVSVATYALATLAAVAGTAVFLQERALRRKELSALTRRLPSIAHAEGLEVRFLILAELVLGIGILTGMAMGYLSDGRLLEVDHKVVFSLLAFGVIAALLILHHQTGLRGRRAARVVLLAYLLLTLAYPGVKFVTDVLMG